MWEARWNIFGLEKAKLLGVLDNLESRTKVQNAKRKESLPPTLSVDNADDDFGDFTSVNVHADQTEELASTFTAAAILSPVTTAWTPTRPNFRSQYIRAHNLLKAFVPALSYPPHAILAALFPTPAPPLNQQALTLRALALFFSHRVKPLRPWKTHAASLRAAMDLFGEALLTAFDANDSKGDEKAMAQAADASWAVWDPSEGQWELARAWADKHEIFYDHSSQWDPLDNFTCVHDPIVFHFNSLTSCRKDGELNFDAMDAFMSGVMAVLKEQGGRAVRVFPPEATVLLSFAERLANEVVRLSQDIVRRFLCAKGLPGRRIRRVPFDACPRVIQRDLPQSVRCNIPRSMEDC